MNNTNKGKAYLFKYKNKYGSKSYYKIQYIHDTFDIDFYKNWYNTNSLILEGYVELDCMKIKWKQYAHIDENYHTIIYHIEKDKKYLVLHMTATDGFYF